VRIDLPDGTTIRPFGQSHDQYEVARLTDAEVISRHDFDDCPICGAPATHEEDVPPKSIGGNVMTKTCQPCNNVLGRNVEADLANWFHNTVPRPRFRSADVPGRRKSGKLHVGQTPTGEFVLLGRGGHPPEIEEILQSGAVEVTMDLPDPNRYRLAVLERY
jgi:hypothetical protein